MGVEAQLCSFLNLDARWEWVVKATTRPLYRREKPGTHCIGGWMGPRAGRDGCGKSRLHRDSMPGLSSPQRVAIPTELSRPTSPIHTFYKWNRSKIKKLNTFPKLLFIFPPVSTSNCFHLLQIMLHRFSANIFGAHKIYKNGMFQFI